MHVSVLKKAFAALSLIIIALFLAVLPAFSQALLPGISVINKNGKNIISWTSGYNSIRQIGVQRSQDSSFNYSTIGFVHNPGAKVNAFTDNKPAAGYNFYRLFIQLSNGSYFYSNPAKSILSALSISSGNNVKIVSSGAFVPSLYVYTSSDGNVNISLPDAASNHYHLVFFDNNDKKIFEVNNIRQPLLIIDKSNFLHSGWFSFDLFENGKVKEHHKLFIPGQWGGN